ncbi:MAG: leucyl/phenylalanyl-tRNA--protein transferase, partial [Burkholderiales bacterium]|nr:leucyl/phenylalanyl-tRNA--protein transferase [Burkholderiales bacterium]
MRWLDTTDNFPPPESGAADLPLAIGSGLSPEKVVKAYKMGIFPWGIDGGRVFWWSPDPRMVLVVDDFKISRSLRKTLRSGRFDVRRDTAFPEVIRACAETPRKKQHDPYETWISQPFIDTYTALHRQGVAHSVEAWHNDVLAGGLYGLLIGKFFFGESMFARQCDASKVALTHLVDWLKSENVRYIDCQQETPYLASLGAKPVPRRLFLQWLKKA